MDINKVLNNVADTDLRRARKCSNGLFITDTKNGLLELTYTDGTYTLKTDVSAFEYMDGKRPVTLATGPARIVKPVLMQQYVIEYA